MDASYEYAEQDARPGIADLFHIVCPGRYPDQWPLCYALHEGVWYCLMRGVAGTDRYYLAWGEKKEGLETILERHDFFTSDTLTQLVEEALSNHQIDLLAIPLPSWKQER